MSNTSITKESHVILKASDIDGPIGLMLIPRDEYSPELLIERFLKADDIKIINKKPTNTKWFDSLTSGCIIFGSGFNKTFKYCFQEVPFERYKDLIV